MRLSVSLRNEYGDFVEDEDGRGGGGDRGEWLAPKAMAVVVVEASLGLLAAFRRA